MSALQIGTAVFLTLGLAACCGGRESAPTPVPETSAPGPGSAASSEPGPAASVPAKPAASAQRSPAEERRADAERKREEQKAEAERKKEEQKAEAERKQEEQKAEAERKKEEQKAEAERKKEEAARSVIFPDVVQKFIAMNELKQEAFAKTFKGLTLSGSGTVFDVEKCGLVDDSEKWGRNCVKVVLDAGVPRVALYFGTKDKEKASNYAKGDRVTFKGCTTNSIKNWGFWSTATCDMPLRRSAGRAWALVAPCWGPGPAIGPASRASTSCRVDRDCGDGSGGSRTSSVKHVAPVGSTTCAA